MIRNQSKKAEGFVKHWEKARRKGRLLYSILMWLYSELGIIIGMFLVDVLMFKVSPIPGIIGGSLASLTYGLLMYFHLWDVYEKEYKELTDDKNPFLIYKN